MYSAEDIKALGKSRTADSSGKLLAEIIEIEGLGCYDIGGRRNKPHNQQITMYYADGTGE